MLTAALVRVMDSSCVEIPWSGRHAERCTASVRVNIPGDCISNRRPRVQLQINRQIYESGHAARGDAGDPALVDVYRVQIVGQVRAYRDTCDRFLWLLTSCRVNLITKTFSPHAEVYLLWCTATPSGLCRQLTLR